MMLTLKHIHCWETHTKIGTIWFHVAWAYPTDVNKYNAVLLLDRWCNSNFGISGYIGSWINNIEWAEISFLNEAERNWFLLRWQ